MKTKLARLARMGRQELVWRGRAAARIALDRARVSIVPSRWNRAELSGLLARTPELEPARRALAAGRWDDAHRAIAHSVAHQPARFPIAPGLQPALAARLHAAHPSSAAAAVVRAQRIVDGDYDLLGYQGLRFGDGASIDWHFDPVHGRRPPREFWSDVPFLAQENGDHKIIWELNRHQHWLALGRAFWLTGDTLYRTAALAQLQSWLASNPPLIGVNWSSMLELAFRSLSWIWTLNFFANAEGDSGPWTVDLLLALDRQLGQIERHLSYYFSPNTHLLGEALALYVGGVAVPQLARSPVRAALGRRVLIDEITRQIQPDGGHCERSTHYHRYALDFYLLASIVARLAGDPAAALFERAASRLAEAARLLADGRGRLPHIGDDDGGAAFPFTGRALDDVTDSLEVSSALLGRPDLRIGEPTEEAMWLLAQPRFTPALDKLRLAPAPAPARSARLAETGYCVSRTSAGTHLVLDAGPHGFQNAGHAHADALSLTMTVRGTPLLIDPGTHCYTIDPRLRDRMRSTELHNTLTLDERQASVPDGPFSWLHTAHGGVHRWCTHDRFDYADASHDGYAPLEHRRRVLSLHDDLVVVADLVTGSGVRRADVHWHLDPRWAVQLAAHRATASSGNDTVELVFPSGDLDRFVADSASGLGWHSPVYGRLEASTTFRLTRVGAAPFWLVSVFGLRPDNRIEGVTIVPVWSDAGVLDHSLALKITRASTVEHIIFAEPRKRSRASTWRAGDIETDAAMLVYRAPRSNELRSVELGELGLVDASRARGLGHDHFSIDEPSVVPCLYVNREHLANTDHGRPHVRDCRIR